MMKKILFLLCFLTLSVMVKAQDKKARQDFYYTCVMHPEIHEAKPGKCPKCGMDLIKAKEKKTKKEVIKKETSAMTIPKKPAVVVPKKAAVFEVATTDTGLRSAKVNNIAGVWMRPPPPAMASTKPAENMARPNKARLSAVRFSSISSKLVAMPQYVLQRTKRQPLTCRRSYVRALQRFLAREPCPQPR